MTRYLCHDQPDIRIFETTVLDTRPGAAILDRSFFYPGGGGQMADRGTMESMSGMHELIGFEFHEGRIWHKVADNAVLEGTLQASIDKDFRQMMMELHTNLHIINALVYQEFGGALVTGVQMAEDATARIDFDLPGADTHRLRVLELAMNDIITQDLRVFEEIVPLEQSEREPGLLRSKAVTPPPSDDGTIRVIEIDAFDRQACGGTHLASTGESRPVKIIKIENKGRQNRRIRIGLQ